VQAPRPDRGRPDGRSGQGHLARRRRPAGFYGGLALFYLSGDESPLRRDRGIVAVLAALACLALVWSGLFLEKVCGSTRGRRAAAARP
jgi:hypothetical protein